IMNAQDNAISVRDLTYDAPDGPATSFPAYSLAVERVSPERWDAAVSTFYEISVEQTLAYASRRWPSLQPEPRLFYRGRQVAGGVLMMTQRLPLGLASVAIGKWGPMVKDARAPDRDAIYRDMVEAIVDEYAVKR